MTTTTLDAGSRVLQVGPLMPALEEDLRRQYAVERLPEQPEKFLADAGSTFSAVVTTGRKGVDRPLMEALPELGAIVHFGVGYDATDVDAALARQVQVSNTPDVLTDCVADVAVGGLIDIMRGLTRSDRFVRAGRWIDGPFPLTRKVSGSRVGILGMGRIGLAVAHRLEAFGCEVGYHNRSERADVRYMYRPSPAALAEWADAVVITAAGGRGTRGLVSTEVLDALGADGYLVNVARGSVVDESGLVAALENGTIAGAALDVFVDEPHVPAQLREREDVVLLPHIASGTTETRAAMARLTLDNLDSFLLTGSVRTPVPGSFVSTFTKEIQ